MKFLTFIVLLMLVLAQFLKADTQMSEPEDLNFKPNGYTVYVSCINGYKYMFYRETVIQMFERLHTTAVPIYCK